MKRQKLNFRTITHAKSCFEMLQFFFNLIISLKRRYFVGLTDGIKRFSGTFEFLQSDYFITEVVVGVNETFSVPDDQLSARKMKSIFHEKCQQERNYFFDWLINRLYLKKFNKCEIYKISVNHVQRKKQFHSGP